MNRHSSLVIGIIILLVVVFTFGAGCTGQQNGMGTTQNAGSIVTLPAPSALSTGVPAPVVSKTGTCTPMTIIQTDGKEVTLPCNPRRIIVANANAAEMVIGTGAGDRIVGVTDSTLRVPYIMDKIPTAVSIGDWQVPNIERMFSLNPDIVIAYSSSKPKNLDLIIASNISIITLDCFKLSTLASDARALGKITGKMNEAEVYARMVEDSIAQVNGWIKKIPSEKYPEVYFEMYTEYTAAAPGSGADEMLTAAGGKNIAAGVSASSIKVSPEWVVARQPEYIFKVVSSSDTRPYSEILAELKNRPGWSTIPAVQNDRVYVLANDIVYGPRAYVGLVWIAQILHPDEFWDMHPRNMLIDYNNRYVNGTNTTMVIYP